MNDWARSVIIGIALTLAPPALAAEPPVSRDAHAAPGLPEQIGVKLARGVTNFCFGWTEVPKQIYLVGRNEGWLTGSLRGPVDGLGWFVARTIAGMYEIFTFPIPLPPRYQPLMTPEFVWQNEPPPAPPPQTAQH